MPTSRVAKIVRRRNRRPRRQIVAGVVAAGAVIVVLVVGAGGSESGVTPGAPSRPDMPTTPQAHIPTTLPTPSSVAWPLAPALDPVWAETPGGCLRVTVGDQVLYDANPQVPVIPASVTKLLTAAAALRVLGSHERLRTTVHAAMLPVDGVIAGDLWLVGGGDPVLGTDAWAAQLDMDRRLYTSLDHLAEQVAATGVRRVDGRILGDETRFDTDRYVDTWPDRLIADGEAGPLSALSLNDGFRTWGHPGVPLADPPVDVAAIFAEVLAARGVTITGGAGAGKVPEHSIEIAGVDSPPIGELVHAMLRDSDNGTAELVVKELGLRRWGAGTTEAGTRTITDALRGAGVALDGVSVTDGSGLSDAARLTCRTLTQVLACDTDALSGRLSVAGRDGTLEQRLVGTAAAGRLRAKTGSLQGTAALAGYVQAANGRNLEFAYVINGLPHGESGRTLQDRLVLALVAAIP